MISVGLEFYSGLIVWFDMEKDAVEKSILDKQAKTINDWFNSDDDHEFRLGFKVSSLNYNKDGKISKIFLKELYEGGFNA